MTKKATVLYAEDDADDRLLMREAFEDAELSGALQCVNDGQELLDRLKEGAGPAHRECQPALVLLDLNMPRKDGREALKEMKEDCALRDIPVIVLTTSSAEQDIAQARELGAAGFFTKPTSFADLCALIANLRDRWLQPESLTPS